MYDTYLMPHAPTRKKLSLHLVSQQLQTYEALSGAAQTRILVEDEALFKAGLVCSPAAAPVRDVNDDERNVDARL